MKLTQTITTFAVLALLTAWCPLAVFAGDKEGEREKMEDFQADISLQKAAKIALKSFKIRSGELEKENGKLIWSFDIVIAKSKDIVEVQVDAKTGKIVAVEMEGAKEQAKEAEKEGKGKKALTKREKEEAGKKVKKAEKEDEDEEREDKHADSGHHKAEKPDKD